MALSPWLPSGADGGQPQEGGGARGGAFSKTILNLAAADTAISWVSVKS